MTEDYTIGARLTVCVLVAGTLALGLPLFHYVAALMIALVLRYGRGERGLLNAVPAEKTRPVLAEPGGRAQPTAPPSASSAISRRR